MYPYVSRMLVVCIRMLRRLLVGYSYVTRMYSCGVLVMIVTALITSLSSGKDQQISLNFHNYVTFPSRLSPVLILLTRFVFEKQDTDRRR